MKPELLKNFVAIDRELFAKLMRHLGFASAAGYRLGELGLVELVNSETKDNSPWPAAVSRMESLHHYTTAEAIDAKLGWQRAENAQGSRRAWPKAAYLYFPEQGLEPTKIIFAVLNSTGKRCRTGELFAPLEALASRMRSLLGDAKARQEFNDVGIAEHVRALGIDLTSLIDHELRTPLASIAGYTALLREGHGDKESEEFREYWQILESQTTWAIEAIDKLSIALNVRARPIELGEIHDFDADHELRSLCLTAQTRAIELLGTSMAERLHIRYLRSTDRACIVRGNPGLFRWAIWEVLKNAMLYSRHGKVDVSAFVSEQMFVVDIEDDGLGVPVGADDLIFLRFFSDPNGTLHKRGRRGLGLGLFLARQIVERHLGVLVTLRAKGRGAIFRFMWPLSHGLHGDPQDLLRRGA